MLTNALVFLLNTLLKIIIICGLFRHQRADQLADGRRAQVMRTCGGREAAALDHPDEGQQLGVVVHASPGMVKAVLLRFQALTMSWPW